MEFKNVKDRAIAFRDARDWLQFHNPKDLAISISIESAELLELFQWSMDDLERRDKGDLMAEELADIALYCIYLADVLGVDLLEAMADKISKNEGRYSVERSYGSAEKCE